MLFLCSSASNGLAIPSLVQTPATLWGIYLLDDFIMPQLCTTRSAPSKAHMSCLWQLYTPGGEARYQPCLAGDVLTESDTRINRTQEERRAPYVSVACAAGGLWSARPPVRLFYEGGSKCCFSVYAYLRPFTSLCLYLLKVWTCTGDLYRNLCHIIQN